MSVWYRERQHEERLLAEANPGLVSDLAGFRAIETPEG